MTKELDELEWVQARAKNPQDYPADLAKDVWDNKMTLIDNVYERKPIISVRVKWDIWLCKKHFIAQPGVKPSIDPKEEIRYLGWFLKRLHAKNPFLKNLWASWEFLLRSQILHWLAV